jgi:hypothetical protein
MNVHNLDNIIDTDFCKISYFTNTNTIVIKWLLDSCYMSEWEFLEHNEILFNSVEIFNATALCIDAFDFCYPINENCIQQFEKRLRTSKLERVGIVRSVDRLGQFQILKLIKTISLLQIGLTTFDTREKVELWISGNN